MIKLTTAAIDRLKVDLLAIPVCEDIDIHDNPVRIKLISTCTNLEEFSGKAKQKILRYNPPGTTAQRCLFLGLGPGNKTSLETLRAFAGRAVKTALETRQKKIAIMIPTSEKIGMAKDDLLQAIAEGAFLANHIFDKYKEKSKVIPLKEICLLLPSKSTKGQRAIIKRVEIICQATLQAREWISTPSNDKVPE
ncbi:MAG: M17 family peptidase N-terminal domain-containing protein, partial [Desulfobacteraceae bacterium]